jgi:hypothetical protein
MNSQLPNTKRIALNRLATRLLRECLDNPDIALGWNKQAEDAIAQGQSETDFVSHCHPDNRKRALAAYRYARECAS